MKAEVYGENTWLYPDEEPSGQSITELYLARGGHTGIQIYTTVHGAEARLETVLPEGVIAQWYQMRPVMVERNSAPDILTTLNYDEVKDYVTRRAPFEVYDLMEEIENPSHAALKDGRVVLFVRLAAAADAKPTQATARFLLTVDGQFTAIELPLFVTHACVPPACESSFSVNNWLDYAEIEQYYHAEAGSERYRELLDAYLRSLLELRSNHLKLPSGKPVLDENGKVVDFDFTACEAVARRALELGFQYIYGGFVARFRVWNEEEQYLLWDRDVGVTSMEGYRQLKIYFTRLWDLVTTNGWQNQWIQCLVDEPQFPNSMSYRALSGICRKCMPGVTINDPVESTDLQGATDVWCVKQAVFDKYRDDFKYLQKLGEHITVYTCGYPAGKWMNRATDLPLLAGRLAFWRCVQEGFEGFLHWGYNAYAHVDPLRHNCYPCGEDNAMPPGNGFIVYPGENGPLYTLRAQVQLFGAEDAELLRQLSAEKAQELCGKVCRSFEEYDPSEANFAGVHRALLTAFD